MPQFIHGNMSCLNHGTLLRLEDAVVIPGLFSESSEINSIAMLRIVAGCCINVATDINSRMLSGVEFIKVLDGCDYIPALFWSVIGRDSRSAANKQFLSSQYTHRAQLRLNRGNQSLIGIVIKCRIAFVGFMW